MLASLVPILLVPPQWVPKADGVRATLFADFENGRYWYNRAKYPDVASWLSTLAGTFARSSSAYRGNSSGLLESAGSNVLRFHYDPVTLAPKGIFLEGARTNLALWNRDLTNAAWTASNVTAAKDQTGADGSANAASSVTATAGNGTILQLITSGSAARTQSAYVKRLTGSGTVEMTQDNGSTWTPIVLTSNYQRFSVTATLANPIIGFRIVTSGDAIAVDFVQNEVGAFVSSAIATTTATLARSADNPQIPTSPWYDSTIGTFIASFYQSPNSGVGARIVGLSAGDPAAVVVDPMGAIQASAGNAHTANSQVAGLNKIATAYNGTTLYAALNGGAVGTGAQSGNMTAVTAYLGNSSGLTLGLFSQLASFGYFAGIRASNSELQRLTA